LERALNHTLTQSTLQNPCSASGGFETGFTRFNPDDHLGSIVSFVVEQPNPQWFFCRQEHPRPHCQAGMVFAINPGDSMNEFLENARTQPTETASMVQSTDTTQLMPSLTSAASQPGPPGPTTGTMGSSNSGTASDVAQSRTTDQPTASVSQPDSPSSEFGQSPAATDTRANGDSGTTNQPTVSQPGQPPAATDTMANGNSGTTNQPTGQGGSVSQPGSTI
jgi:hypothetical protein